MDNKYEVQWNNKKTLNATRLNDIHFTIRLRINKIQLINIINDVIPMKFIL